MAKNLLLAMIATALALSLLELGAGPLYSIQRKRPFDAEEVRNRLFVDRRAAIPPEADPAEEDHFYLTGGDAAADQPAILHPYFGFVFNPAWPGINQYGFVGSQPFNVRSPDALIVGILGGSVADHLFKSAGDIMADALQLHPPFSSKRVKLINLAVMAYKQPQQLLVLSTLLALGAQFDIVVNLDGFNEIDAVNDNLEDGLNPFYPYMWKLYGRRSLDGPTAVHVANAHLIRSRREALRSWFARWPVGHSALLLVLWDVLDQRQVAALRAETLALKQLLAGSDATAQVTGPVINFADEEAMYLDFTEVWARSSLALSMLCRGMGIQYLHFLQPNQYVPGSKTLTAEERRVAYDPDGSAARRVAIGYPMLIDRGRELAEREGVNFIDLTMLFHDEPRTVYRDTCCHLNGHGNAQLATAIARAIVQHNDDGAGNAEREAAEPDAEAERD